MVRKVHYLPALESSREPLTVVVLILGLVITCSFEFFVADIVVTLPGLPTVVCCVTGVLALIVLRFKAFKLLDMPLFVVVLALWVIGLGVTAAVVTAVEGLWLNVGAEEACGDLCSNGFDAVFPTDVGGLGDRRVECNSGFLNVPGAVTVVVLGAVVLLVTGVFVNDVVARLFDDPPNVILDVTVGLAEAVVLVLLGLLNEGGAECVVVAVGFFSSALWVGVTAILNRLFVLDVGDPKFFCGAVVVVVAAGLTTSRSSLTSIEVPWDVPLIVTLKVVPDANLSCFFKFCNNSGHDANVLLNSFSVFIVNVPIFKDKLCQDGVTRCRAHPLMKSTSNCLTLR